MEAFIDYLANNWEGLSGAAAATLALVIAVLRMLPNKTSLLLLDRLEEITTKWEKRKR